jgi:heme exporter protein B
MLSVGVKPSTRSAFMLTLKRDLLIAFKRKNDIVNPFMFFVIVISLFPLAISPEGERLTEIAAGVIWIAVLLSAMLSMDSLYRGDFEDGSLEILLSPHPLFFLVLAKNIAHWLVSGLPVVIASPLLAYMLKLPSESYATLMLTLLIGTPTLSLIGSIAVALTVGLGSRGLILAVITLPFSVPVLIFGTLAVQASASGLPSGGYLTLLLALLAGSLSLAPLTSAAALRISVS